MIKNLRPYTAIFILLSQVLKFIHIIIMTSMHRRTNIHAIIKFKHISVFYIGLHWQFFYYSNNKLVSWIKLFVLVIFIHKNYSSNVRSCPFKRNVPCSWNSFILKLLFLPNTAAHTFHSNVSFKLDVLIFFQILVAAVIVIQSSVI